MFGIFVEAGYTVALENSSIMPLTAGADGRLHTRRADLVASALGRGPRLIADVVTTDSFDSRSVTRSAEEAGYAARQAADAKERKYSDHPVGDEFVPLAVDVHGAFGAKWLDLLHRLAHRAAARRHGQQGEQPGFHVAGSLAQLFRMRLAVSLQRSLAFAERDSLEEMLVQEQLKARGAGLSLHEALRKVESLERRLVDLDGETLEPLLIEVARLRAELAKSEALRFEAHRQLTEGPGGALTSPEEMHRLKSRIRELEAQLFRVSEAAQSVIVWDEDGSESEGEELFDDTPHNGSPAAANVQKIRVPPPGSPFSPSQGGLVQHLLDLGEASIVAPAGLVADQKRLEEEFKVAQAWASEAELSLLQHKQMLQELEVKMTDLQKQLDMERARAVEDAEDAAQEMAELRYHFHQMLDNERELRSQAEHTSVRRVDELEAQVNNAQKNVLRVLAEKAQLVRTLQEKEEEARLFAANVDDMLRSARAEAVKQSHNELLGAAELTKSTLRDSMRKLETERTTLDKKVEEQHSKLAEAMDDLAASRQRVREVSQERDQAASKVSELQRTLDDATSTTGKLADKLDRVEEQLFSLRDIEYKLNAICQERDAVVEHVAKLERSLKEAIGASQLQLARSLQTESQLSALQEEQLQHKYIVSLQDEKLELQVGELIFTSQAEVGILRKKRSKVKAELATLLVDSPTTNSGHGINGGSMNGAAGIWLEDGAGNDNKRREREKELALREVWEAVQYVTVEILKVVRLAGSGPVSNKEAVKVLESELLKWSDSDLGGPAGSKREMQWKIGAVVDWADDVASSLAYTRRELMSLQRQLLEFENDLRQLDGVQAERAGLAREAARLQDELEALQGKLTSEQVRREEQARSLERQADQARAAVRLTRTQLVELEEVNAHLTSQLCTQEGKAENSERDEQRRKLAADLVSLELAMLEKTTHLELAGLDCQLAERRAEEAQRSGRVLVANMEARISSLRIELKIGFLLAADEQVLRKDAESLHENVSKALEAAQARCAELTGELESSRGEVQSAAGKVASLSVACRKADEELLSLRVELSGLGSQWSAKTSKFAADLADCRRDLQGAQTSLKSSEGQAVTLLEEKQRLEVALASLREELQEESDGWKRKEVALQEERSYLTEQIAQLEKRMKALEEELAASSQREEVLRAQLEVAEEEGRNTKQALRSSEQRLVEERTLLQEEHEAAMSTQRQAEDFLNRQLERLENVEMEKELIEQALAQAMAQITEAERDRDEARADVAKRRGGWGRR
eukprot:SM000381S14608  [mRNA]  locus=s381:57266:65972:- [translate_table: standard]